MELLNRWGLVAAVGVALLLGACSRDVDPPEFDNPFDPRGSSDEDPYELTATVVGDAVLLRWNNVRGQSGFREGEDDLRDIYIIEHSVDGGAFDDADGLEYPSAPQIGQPILARHVAYVPERVNSYTVEANDITPSEGLFVDVGSFVGSATVSVDPPLEVTTASGDALATTRDVTFVVRSGVSTSVEFAFDEAFTTEAESTAIVPGEDTEVTIRVGAFSSADDSVEVFHRGLTDGGVGAVGSTVLSPSFVPAFTAQAGVRQNAARQPVAVDSTVTYRALGEGVTAITVQTLVDPDGPGTGEDPMPVDLFEVADPGASFVLPLDDERAYDENTERWTFRLLAASDLGYSSPTTIRLEKAGPVSGAVATIIDEDGNGVTTSPEIRLRLVAVDAGEVILSESADFAGATWAAFADTVSYTLSGGFGEKTVYAGFRNDFDPGFVVTASSIIYVSDQPPAGAQR